MCLDSSFRVTCERRGDSAVITVTGELDLDSADVLRQTLGTADAQAPTVVLDLRAVTFIDSSGLSVVVERHRQASADECRFVVAVGGAHAVERLLELTGLHEVIALVQDPDSALEP